MVHIQKLYQKINLTIILVNSILLKKIKDNNMLIHEGLALQIGIFLIVGFIIMFKDTRKRGKKWDG